MTEILQSVDRMWKETRKTKRRSGSCEEQREIPSSGSFREGQGSSWLGETGPLESSRYKYFYSESWIDNGHLRPSGSLSRAFSTWWWWDGGTQQRTNSNCFCLDDLRWPGLCWSSLLPANTRFIACHCDDWALILEGWGIDQFILVGHQDKPHISWLLTLLSGHLDTDELLGT